MDIISIILICGFLYYLVKMFRQDYYGFAFVMFIGVMVFYANLFAHLAESWQFWLMVVTCLVLICLGGTYVYQAVKATNNVRHHWYAAGLVGLALVLTIIFNFIF